ncbi:MAG: ABC transporter ATP-binding protein [Spirochaetes bacterium]|nr:ABC transporter ATP-binding protein [Spirochaetota bacterium]
MKLNVAGIKFSYNHFPVLDDVSFSLEPGRILGVLGVNGAGKTTILKCLNRILTPGTGSVYIDGREVRHMHRNAIAKYFGYVPQRSPDSLLTVFDSVLLGRRPYIKWNATKKDLLIVEDILRQLGCAHLSQRVTSELSGGELQKVIIARALAQEPKVLLLDEPTSSLDLKNQLQVMNIIKNAVHNYNLSAVVSMHDINLALRFADSFLMLKDGNVRFLSGKSELSPDVIEEVYGVKVIINQVNDYQIIIPYE